MSRTISSLYNFGFALTGGESPLFILGSAGFHAASGQGISGDASEAWTITNAGLVQSDDTTAIVLAAAGSEVHNSGTASRIIGQHGGVYLTGGGTVTNDGTIKSNGVGSGIVINGGAVTNAATGLIQSVDAAVVLNAAGTVTNQGSISGANGVSLSGGSAVYNTGTIEGVDTGAYLSGGGSVTNGGTAATAARIAGGKYGVRFASGFGTVTNFGTIAATSGSNPSSGIAMAEAGLVANGSTDSAAASISGAFNGILMGQGASADGTVLNEGTVASDRVAIRIVNGGTVVNGSGTASAALISGATGVDIGWYDSGYAAGGPGTVVNAGTIAGTSGAAIQLTHGGTVDNTGTIQGTNHGVAVDHGSGTVGNEGSIAGGSGAGIRLIKGGSVVNGAGTGTATATVTGAFGVQIGYAGYVGYTYVEGGSGTVLNTGTIDGTASRGVHLMYGGSVGNYGSIHGYLDGILTWWQATTVTNEGTITGQAGVRLFDAAGTVANTGTIIGSYGHGIYLGAGGSVSNGGTVFAYGWGTGVAADGLATVGNTGTIDGAGGGVRLQAGGTVSNLGTGASISGYTRGVAAYYGGTVINEGRIASTYDAVTIDGGGQVTNAVSGIISGGTGIRGGGAAATVINAGTIEGTAGNAIDLAAGGTVANGSPTLTSALITATAGDGVRIGNSSTATGTITNDGTIAAAYVAPGGYVPYPFASGVRLLDGGMLTNGSDGNTLARISGAVGVQTGHYYNRYPDRGFEGEASVLNRGTITGINRAGVALYGGGTLTNLGSIAGYGTGVGGSWSKAITVLNDGTITSAGTYSSSYGIGVNLPLDGSSLANGSTINHAALVSGANYGVWAADGSTVANHGTILGNIAGIEINSGTVTNAEGGLVSGTQNGIYMLRAGEVTNEGSIAGGTAAGVRMVRGTLATNGTATATAQIEGTIGVEMGYGVIGGYGTYASGPGTVVNAGTILGHAASPIGYGFPGDSGIGVMLRDGGSVGNGGYVYGDFIGIQIASTVGTAGTVHNTGTIDSAYYGVLFQGSAGTVTNDGGTIGGGIGVRLNSGGGVANLGTTALIDSSGGAGIYIRGTAGTVTNEGTVSGHYAVYIHDGGSLTNSGTASVIASPSGFAVRTGGAMIIANEGEISGTGGIRTRDDATITNGSTLNATALIAGYGRPAIGAYNHAATVVNYGTLSAAYGDAVYLEEGGSVTNAAGGTISAGFYTDSAGIYAYADATVTNAGSIAGFYGVSLRGGSVANTGTASQIAGMVGIYGAPGSAPVSVSNEGTIAGLGAGMALLSGGSVTNSGTGSVIRGPGVGIHLAGAATVSNEGTVEGAYGAGIGVVAGRTRIVNGSATDATALITGQYGASFVGGPGVVSNFGTIAGTYSGVAFQSRLGVVTNRGLIQAPGSGGTAGYAVVLGKGGRLANLGTIAGTYGVVAGYPCGCSPGGAATVTNRGTIVGTGGVAVQLGAFDDTVALNSKAVFGGSVIAGDGHDVLALQAGGPPGSLSGLGTGFTGFESVSLAAGSRWSLAGSNTLDSGSTIGGAGRLTVTGDLSVPGTLHIEGTGTLAPGAAGTIEIGGVGGGAAGRITVDAGGTLAGNGVLRGAVTDRGLIEAAGGTLTMLGNVGGSGTIAITAGAVLDARANLSVRSIVFAGTGTDETLLAAKADRLVGTISGFGDHDAIDLTGFLDDPGQRSFAGDTLTLHELGGPGTATLHFAPGYSLGDFVIAPDSGSGTLITHA